HVSAPRSQASVDGGMPAISHWAHMAAKNAVIPLLSGTSLLGELEADDFERAGLAALHVDFALPLIASPSSACHPASLILIRATSVILPSATMRSACADASPTRTSSTSNSAVNPFANISASVQPSGEAASNSRARRRSGLGPWRRR